MNPDAGIKTFKDLKGKKVLTTASAGVNTLFPGGRCQMPAPTSARSSSPTSPRVRSSRAICRAWRPAMLGGIDDKPAEIKANGGKPAGHLHLCRLQVYQPGYAIVARKEMVQQNPDLVKRFVAATLQAYEEARKNPDAVDPGPIIWSGSVRGPEGAGARGARRDAEHPVLAEQQGQEARPQRRRRLGRRSDMLKKYKDLKTDQPASAFYTNDFIPASLNRAASG